MSGGFKMADAYVEVTADTTKAEKEASGPVSYTHLDFGDHGVPGC